MHGYSPTDKFMCSYDIASLFTCVPLAETLDIRADALYRSHLSPPVIPEDVFVELMKFATMSVKFSFDGIMYRQIDDVSMGSSLGPILANISVQEESVLLKSDKPDVYFRYVDDTFCLFDNEIKADQFLASLNNIHPALKFTQKKEVDSSLPFLDVLVSRSASGFIYYSCLP